MTVGQIVKAVMSFL